MSETLLKIIDVLVFFAVLGAWYTLAWSFVKICFLGQPDRKENPEYHEKLSRVLYIGSILWFLVWVFRMVAGFPAWGYLLFAIAMYFSSLSFFKSASKFREKE